jgi:hypothetical protein
MMIAQGFNPETGDLSTFVEHCERAETTEAIDKNFNAASEDEHENRKERKKSKREHEQSDNRKEKNTSRRDKTYYCSVHGDNTSHNTRDCKVFNAAAPARRNDRNHDDKKVKRKYRELHVLQAEAEKQKAKYEKLHKALNKNKIHDKGKKDDSDDTSSHSSSSSSDSRDSPIKLTPAATLSYDNDSESSDSKSE